ncbi:AKH_1a_G0002960.mRNA.1.CDS.1 [Saccharomyces cerevisiae]|nr:AKH_1a_G0002960.mRNA.1.CDS.1 [Saccharomyces cerevisiae]CAI4271163.1 ACH_G0002950.mRNA.1.CDS.1 [Saccharomyces cerevisiae]CAI6492683.1 ACH_G0002950.mRNA.1.CDS.1 [Saccharomyces cerevisiae]CAI6494362.1 AKH_1a_G0002960.mRNA.1.CDS.1 [Saccharomyces cerevisiae]
MGAQLSLVVQASPSIAIFSYIDVLEEVHYVSQLNSSRFLKTCKALDPNGEIVIKVFIKPKDQYSLRPFLQRIRAQSFKLGQLPHVLNYSKLIETNRAGYMIRQHLKNNLYDRLSLRPYLQDIELKFIAFQLLNALKDIHNLNIVHGDIKTENILVTSWNWCILTDFAAFIKPVYLPEDNPGEFLFYFDTSKRRTCYLAPERFNSKLYQDGKSNNGRLTKEMDIFSLGCVIAEIFAEGRPIFNLSQLFKYKSNSYDVNREFLMEEMNSTDLRNLVLDMIQLDPSKRLSCDELLNKYRGIFFPDYFYTFIYDYFRNLVTMTTSTPISDNTCTNSTLEDNVKLLDETTEKIHRDFSQICHCLDFPLIKDGGEIGSDPPILESYKIEIEISRFLNTNLYFPQNYHLVLQQFTKVSEKVKSVKEECALLFISYLSHSIRSIVSTATKLKNLELLAVFAQFVSDENKIDRVVPYFVCCFEDSDQDVQALSLLTLIQVLTSVRKLNQLNENIFVDYLLPRLKRLLISNRQNTNYLRIVFANCLSDLAIIINRFQEFTFAQHCNDNSMDNNTEIMESSTKYSAKLIQSVEDLTVSFLTDNDTYVKMALLQNILPLCKFFGRERTNDIILSHLITYLNDKDPALRVSLIQTISGISILLGTVTLEQYILPLLIQTITDSEELVVISVLQSLKSLFKTGLIRKKYYIDISKTTSPLLLHPNNWIRQFTLMIIIEIINKLSKAEVYCILYPIIRPFFEFDVEFNFKSMISCCKQPVSRSVYNLLCSWSVRASKSLFWKKIITNHVDSFGNNRIEFITKNYSNKNYGFNKRDTKSSSSLKGIKTSSTVYSHDNKEIPLTAEDRNWIDKFHIIGLTEKDIWKIVALRGYVIRTARVMAANPDFPYNNSNYRPLVQNSPPNLNLTNIMPRNIFFDVEFAEESTSEGQDSNLENQQIYKYDESEKDSNKLNINGSKQLSTVMDINGSLIFKNKSIATTTSNLKNVFVQLEPTSYHMHSPNHGLKDNANVKPERKVVVSNSYEGDVESIEKFLSTFKILPPLRDYKEFGPIQEIVRSPNMGNLRGKLIATLMENEPNSITSSAVSPGETPYLITGSDQGVIKIWNLKEIIVGEVYSSSLTYDCSSTVTQITMIPNFDAFAVSSKDGQIIVLKVNHYQQESEVKFLNCECIRKINLKNFGKNEYAVRMRAFVNEEKSLLVALTNLSRVIIFDIRTLERLQIIENSPRHGAVSSICIDEECCVLILGTTRGIIDIWDIRFNVLIRSWSFGDHTPITHVEVCQFYGKNSVIVVGGSSKTFLTIWNFVKGHCQYAFINSDEQPSMEHFLPIEKGLEELNFCGIRSLNALSTISVSNDKILLTDEATSSIVMFSLNELSSSKAVISPSRFSDVFIPTQVTANLTMLLRKMKRTSTHSVDDSLYHHDIINSISTCEVDETPLLVACDNSGLIGIFQ